MNLPRRRTPQEAFSGNPHTGNLRFKADPAEVLLMKVEEAACKIATAEDVRRHYHQAKGIDMTRRIGAKPTSAWENCAKCLALTRTGRPQQPWLAKGGGK
jgi:hypothetical protein